MDVQIPAYAGCAARDFNLVLEGGALRCMFTAGVCDLFMEKGLYPREAIGVSAGALVGYPYVAGYHGRTAYINMKYANDWRYLSLKSFALTGNVAGRDFMFKEIPQKLEPFDQDLFNNSITKLTAVCANLETGEAVYHTFKDMNAEFPYLIATSSLPVLSQPVEIDGMKLLDGGICDSIPYSYSFGTGVAKHVVVLTRDAAYRKGPDRLSALEEARYGDYPLFTQRQRMRFWDYNRAVVEVQRLEEAGAIFVIRPQQKVTVKQLEKDTDKLLDLYTQGYAEAARRWDDLVRYLGI